MGAQMISLPEQGIGTPQDSDSSDKDPNMFGRDA